MSNHHSQGTGNCSVQLFQSNKTISSLKSPKLGIPCNSHALKQKYTSVQTDTYPSERFFFSWMVILFLKQENNLQKEVNLYECLQTDRQIYDGLWRADLPLQGNKKNLTALFPADGRTGLQQSDYSEITKVIKNINL